MRQLTNRVSDRALFRKIARSRRMWNILDRVVFRGVPALLLVIIFLLHYPPTAIPIRRHLSEWYYSRHRPSFGSNSAVQTSLTRSIC